MKLRVMSNPEELGREAAKQCEKILNKAISEKGQARLMLSTGVSQFETLKYLVTADVDWSRVEMFHLDKYIGIKEDHPASLRKYLKDRFISQINLKNYYLVESNGDVVENIRVLTEKINQAPIDLGVIGIGENAHIAFNDPPADFDTTEAFKVVTLDKRCRQQQLDEGWFATLDDVPKQAISVTPYQIMKCEKIISCVPHSVKAQAIKDTLYSEVSNKVPATLLRNHPDWTLFLDENSAKYVVRNDTKLPIRCGVVGIGKMGMSHAKSLYQGLIDNMCLIAVADTDPKRLELAKENFTDIKLFSDAQEMYDSGLIDAVIIATPHYDHPSLTQAAFKIGLHVMVEKPSGVYTSQVREMNDAAKDTNSKFAIMFCLRTDNAFRKIREIVESKKYGDLRRVNWIITNWFRTQEYYNRGEWRATWSGEGGGVLLNQCPHQLDLWQWICGMPKSIRAVCKYGLWHDIEVEDDVVIYAEYENGASGVFVASTGDYPGTNRLEITLDKAKIIYENNSVIQIYELAESQAEVIANSKKPSPKIEINKITFETDTRVTSHKGVLEAFSNHIIYNTPLVAKGEEGLNELLISNAAYLSSWLEREISIPFDEELFYSELQKRILASKKEKQN